MKRLILITICLSILLGCLSPISAAQHGEYYPQYTGNGTLLEALNSLGIDSSFAHRASISEANGISTKTQYKGTYLQNVAMLSLLKQGKLRDPDFVAESTESKHYYPAYKGASTSLSDSLAELGINNSYSHRCRIAQANGISDYSGKYEQNVELFSKLSQGTLIDPDKPPIVAGSTNGTTTIGIADESITQQYESFTTIVTTTNTTIREDSYQNSKVLSKVRKGAYLFCTGSVTNRYGNVWHKVVDITSGSEGFIYSKKTKSHECQFREVDGAANLVFCTCGKIKQQSSGIMPINSIALPANVLDPEVATAIASMLATAGSVAASVASVAVPVIAIGTAFGVGVYILVNVAQNAVTIEEVTTDLKKLDKNFKPDEGVYYSGVTKDGFFFVDVLHPMDVNEAEDEIMAGILNNRLAQLDREKFMWFIYTLTDFSALCLVEEFLNSYPNYVCNYVEDKHTTGNCMKQFKHYHIMDKFGPGSSHLGGHIMFGSPCLDTFNQGAWA